ncbi:glycoside hydrolase family 13 protein [Streptomyces sp. NPDC020472]|uniref:glycoside hydrolase family 13 protein n=1 Tax=Streptomyces sp. NPDC020472 TaxID=3365075 RepID=UPI003794DEA6
MDARPTPPGRTPGAPAAATVDWWRSAVIYQVYIRSFKDSDGDGIGDLQGLRAELGHLAALGVDAVWINPFYTSPMVDAGYDVADHRDVDPSHGTLADFKELLSDAHALGLRVLVDIVPNHTSSQHAWFTEALQSPPGSAARARYHFHPGAGDDGAHPPNNWRSVFGGPAWTRVPAPDSGPHEWYLHLFTPGQPDLNWENPQVHAEFEDILRFWLDLGVDGFRIDVANAMIKAPGYPDMVDGPDPDDGSSPCWDRDDVHRIHQAWRHVLDSYPDQRIAVAEAWVPTVERLARYLRPDELHQAFNFDYLKADWSAAGLRRIIDDCLTGLAVVDTLPTWVLSNHDVVRHRSRFGDGETGLRRARAAALLMLALPGSAYIYQGDELGLPEVTDLPDAARQDPIWHHSAGAVRGRDGCRVPLPWYGDAPPFGFGPPDSTSPWLPQPAAWGDLAVAAQSIDPGSTLNLYRAALQLRRNYRGAREGRLTWRSSTDDAASGLLFFTRSDGLACAVNMGSAPHSVVTPGRRLLANGAVTEDADRTVLPPDTAVWWHVDIADREEVVG